jgi:hypothetical protein
MRRARRIPDFQPVAGREVDDWYVSYEQAA